MNEIELAAKWDSEIKKARMARMPYEQQWHMNMAFYMRRHWVTWSSAGNRLVEPVQNPRKVRLTINKTRIAIRRELAKLNKEKIRGYIAAASSDDVDLAAARAGEKINDYLVYAVQMQRKMSLVDFYCLIYGTSFAKHYYDPFELGPEGPAYDEMNPAFDKIPGMPELEALSPFHILVPNIDAVDIEEQEWVAQESVMTKQQVWEEYEVEVEEEGIIGDSGVAMEQKAYGQLANQAKKGIAVYEIWIRPNKEYPQGAVITKTKDKILRTLDSWPYAHGEYPFSRRKHIETGRFYGESTITDLIPVQVEYNKSRSQLIENKDRMARPQLLAPKGSIDVRKMNSNPGLVIEYRQGFNPPTPMPMAQLPDYVIEHMTMLSREMEDLTSQYEISQGRVPPGVEAATAISYLLENQDSVLQDSLRDKEMVWEKACKQFLSYVIQYWDAERMIRVAGRNNNFESFLLKGPDLRGNYDYRVEVGSATPVARSAKQAQIMELVKLGMIPVEKGLQHLEMGDTAKLFEQMQEDARQAERENLKMSNGVPTNTNPFDEHLQHIQIHDSFRKREEYENLEPDKQVLVQLHVIDHLVKAATVAGVKPEQLMPDAMWMNDPQKITQFEEILRGFILQVTPQEVPPNGS